MLLWSAEHFFISFRLYDIGIGPMTFLKSIRKFGHVLKKLLWNVTFLYEMLFSSIIGDEMIALMVRLGGMQVIIIIMIIELYT